MRALVHENQGTLDCFEKVSMTSTISISNSRAGLIIESIEYRHKKNEWVESNYRTRAIIIRGLYIFYPLFEGQKRFFKEVFPEISAFMYG